MTIQNLIRVAEHDGHGKLGDELCCEEVRQVIFPIFRREQQRLAGLRVKSHVRAGARGVAVGFGYIH